MTKGEYPYPEDEFDAVERDSVPRGVHRAPRSMWTRAWPFVLVLVVFPALAYGAVTYWSIEHVGAPSASSTTTQDAVPEDTPAATPAETPAATQSPTTAPAAAPDLSTPVVVFNATSRSGLAADAAKVLKDAKWTSVTPQNYTGGTLPSSTVLYGTPELEATARAAADALGIETVKIDDTVKGLEIILEGDYTP